MSRGQRDGHPWAHTTVSTPSPWPCDHGANPADTSRVQGQWAELELIMRLRSRRGRGSVVIGIFIKCYALDKASHGKSTALQYLPVHYSQK